MYELNLEEQAEEIGIDKKHLLSLYYIFVNQTDDDMKDLKGLIDSKDCASVKDMAHHIKGASLNLEITTMSDLAKTLESQCINDEQWNDIELTYQELYKEFHLLKTKLSEVDGHE